MEVEVWEGGVEGGGGGRRGRAGAPHLHFLFRKWNKHSAGSIVDASSTLVPSLQALHKDTLKKKKKKRELTASSRFTVAKAMTSCEPRTCLFIGAWRLSGSAQGGWRVPWKGPGDSHLQTWEGVGVKHLGFDRYEFSEADTEVSDHGWRESILKVEAEAGEGWLIIVRLLGVTEN